MHGVAKTKQKSWHYINIDNVINITDNKTRSQAYLKREKQRVLLHSSNSTLNVL